MKNFAVFMKYRSGRVALVTLECSPHDCFCRLPEALDEWTLSELRQVDEYWVSMWHGTPSRGNWRILDWIECRKSRLSNAVRSNQRLERACNFVLK
jgi:hypothetical protein